ncbi:hypothetical protein L911_2661 [Vibrio fluvialis I21563]|uniref:Uncharacterized protein n=1 Tax=Vibrio fluvialis PG41 TaxID=1336752 RepID=S7I741_VIBFL|nr:hypothetical protein L910_3730 [Vibrio fluvialis PG41]EPP27257.1 hypothetical protein L911_2661 [Vibrio fluvialis I21563]
MLFSFIDGSEFCLTVFLQKPSWLPGLTPNRLAPKRQCDAGVYAIVTAY